MLERGGGGCQAFLLPVKLSYFQFHGVSCKNSLEIGTIMLLYVSDHSVPFTMHYTPCTS